MFILVSCNKSDLFCSKMISLKLSSVTATLQFPNERNVINTLHTQSFTFTLC